MKQSNTLYRIGVVTGILAISAALFTSGYLVSENRAKGGNKDGDSLVIDLPEEISVIGKKMERMQAYRSNDTIYVQFPE